MPPSYVNFFFRVILLFIGVTIACSAYAYFLDTRRSPDDPNKRNYSFAAIFFAPVTLPVFVLLWVMLFLLKALLFGIVLVLFPVALLVIRKPFLLVALHKTASYVGNSLLEANTMLIKLFLKPWREERRMM